MTGPRQPPQGDRDGRAEPPAPPSDLGTYLLGLSRAVARSVEEDLAPHDLSMTDYAILGTCLERAEHTATELAALLPVDPSRISRMVSSLVDRGLLRRRRLRTDRRIIMLRLSDEGRELALLVRDRIREHDARLTGDVSEAEMEVFMSVARRIRANSASAQEPGPPAR